MEPIQEIAVGLLRRGYVPLRVDPDSKAARNTGWQIHTPTEETLIRDFARPSNLGIRLGDAHKDGTVLIAVDIDIEEPELIGCVERALGVKVPVKRGRKGYTYLFRLDREHKTHKLYWSRDDKKIAAIDVLCKNSQTVIPPSIHPDTGKPYTWVNSTPIWEVDYKDLPVFGPSIIDEIRGFCKNPDDPIYALNHMEWRGVGGGGNTHDTCLVAVSSMVARKWTDEDIHARVERAKREACEAVGASYDWPQSTKIIQGWIDSSRDKQFDKTSKHKVDNIPIDIINRYVYVISINRMYDLKVGRTIDQGVFDNMHARDLPKPWKMVLMHPDFRHVDKLTYAPGQPKFCKEKSFDSEAVLDCLNVYSAPDIEPHEGDVTPFIDMVKKFCDDRKEAYEHVFSFFAYAIQNPGARINHALVFQGEQGIGKDSIIKAIELVVGQQNTSFVSLQNIESQFNEWLFGKQFIIFQEILAAGRRNIYNKLKPYITDEVHNVNTKHINLQKMHNRAFYVFLTNYKHALSIDPSDRRAWVWYSKMEPQPKEYYKKFYQWLSDPKTPKAMLHWLQRYDTSAFNPSAPPPMTDAKRSLIESSASEIEQFLRQAAENQTWPMAYDLVSVPHVMGAIRGMIRCSASMVMEALDNIAPDSDIETRPRFGQQRLRLRAIRNYDKWKKASGPELAKAYRMPLPPQSGETEGNYMAYGDGSGERSADAPDF